MDETQFDVAVIGGGLSGYAAALGAVQCGMRVFHAAPTGGKDPRTSALMMPTLAFLQTLGVFDPDDPLGVPLSHIHLIDCTNRLVRAGETHFSAAEIGQASFGYNIVNVDLLRALRDACLAHTAYCARDASMDQLEQGDADTQLLSFSHGSGVNASLVIGADGKASAVRAMNDIALKKWSYPQSALVCDLECGFDHEDTSFELHYEFGPFTLVPAGGSRSNLVWVDEPGVLAQAMALSDEAFEAQLAEKSHGILGTLRLASRRFVFPLAGGRAACFGRSGSVLVGEAAHYFPPIGAQGLNLGLRDVADLISLLKDAPKSLSALPSAYDQARREDIRQTTFMVDTLNRSLLSGFLPVQIARSMGIWALGHSSQLRQHAFASGMGM